MQWKVFVYGTLKQGYGNHQKYCQNITSIEPAAMWGQLFQLPQKYPMLLVPEATVLALGTADPLADARTWQQYSAAWPQHRPAVAPAEIAGDWQWIEGEILTSDQPLELMPKLDALENFVPGGTSYYHRALVPVHREWSSTVWVYISPTSQLPPGAFPIGSSWPP